MQEEADVIKRNQMEAAEVTVEQPKPAAKVYKEDATQIQKMLDKSVVKKKVKFQEEAEEDEDPTEGYEADSALPQTSDATTMMLNPYQKMLENHIAQQKQAQESEPDVTAPQTDADPDEQQTA